jgi:hypothetical protein
MHGSSNRAWLSSAIVRRLHDLAVCIPGKTQRWKAKQGYFTYLSDEVQTSLHNNYACTSELKVREYLV